MSQKTTKSSKVFYGTIPYKENTQSRRNLGHRGHRQKGIEII